jgi:hypothetical protein
MAKLERLHVKSGKTDKYPHRKKRKKFQSKVHTKHRLKGGIKIMIRYNMMKIRTNMLLNMWCQKVCQVFSKNLDFRYSFVYLLGL